uniref:alpha-amylase n=1 Tax=Ditylenchus dipsaci TaxID=166011 RepID=A0A915CRB8_9BILA
MLHLFEWKWDDIAKECENFLAKNDYGAVQVSPPTEHLFREIDIDGKGRKDLPWYVRYQPVSYKLISRSGNEEQFRGMVDRCNKAGVRIVVDVVLNHMAGAGQVVGEYGVNSSGGSFFNSTPGFESFPGVNYTKEHFNDFRCNGDIQPNDYNHNPEGVRNCRFHGVVGFRMDAAKHMWPADLEAIINRMDNLKKEIFGENKKPFLVQEVIDKGGEAIKADEYTNLGRFTNFNFGIALANAVQNWDNKNLASLSDLHEGYNYGNLADHDVLNFVDNHDNQRYEKDHILTHKKGEIYKLAVAFMLAWTYGYPRVMSSYYFDHNNQGPPSSGSPRYETKSPKFNPDGTCKSESGWVCEHRWPEIRRMVKFRADVTGAVATAFYKEPNILGFARLGKGYFVANNNDEDKQLININTTLAPGNYCNIYLADFSQGNDCPADKVIKVDSEGKANISVPSRSIVAFSLRSKLGQQQNGLETNDQTSSWKKTAIFIKKDTQPGENVFIRGGNSNQQDCQLAPSKENKCAISIVHSTKIEKNSSSNIYSYYQKWKLGDQFLDFVGAEEHQGKIDGISAEGTPMIWTTDDKSQPTYNYLNHKYRLGNGYWMAELSMDCSQINNGIFEIKAVLHGSWEPDIVCGASNDQCSSCNTNTTTVNHLVKCGAVNILSGVKQTARLLRSNW